MAKVHTKKPRPIRQLRKIIRELEAHGVRLSGSTATTLTNAKKRVFAHDAERTRLSSFYDGMDRDTRAEKGKRRQRARAQRRGR